MDNRKRTQSYVIDERIPQSKSFKNSNYYLLVVQDKERDARMRKLTEEILKLYDDRTVQIAQNPRTAEERSEQLKMGLIELHREYGMNPVSAKRIYMLDAIAHLQTALKEIKTQCKQHDPSVISDDPRKRAPPQSSAWPYNLM